METFLTILRKRIIFQHKDYPRGKTLPNNLNPSSAVIDKLHTIHGRCSGGGLHSGTEHEENPLDVEELSSMCLELRTIKDRK